MASAEPERVHREDENTGAQVAVTTGEEDEETLLDLKAKLYLFDIYGEQWRERGRGTVKLLKHRETNKVRLLMAQYSTLEILANHLIMPTSNVKEHLGSENSCVWHAVDFADDGELMDEFFCLRFPSIQNCRSFMETFTQVVESQSREEENEDATAAAGLLERLTVEEEEAAASEAVTEENPEPEGER